MTSFCTEYVKCKDGESVSSHFVAGHLPWSPMGAFGSARLNMLDIISRLCFL